MKVTVKIASRDQLYRRHIIRPIFLLQGYLIQVKWIKAYKVWAQDLHRAPCV